MRADFTTHTYTTNSSQNAPAQPSIKDKTHRQPEKQGGSVFEPATVGRFEEKPTLQDLLRPASESPPILLGEYNNTQNEPISPPCRVPHNLLWVHTEVETRLRRSFGPGVSTCEYAKKMDARLRGHDNGAYPFFCALAILAQVSRRVTVRLKTRWSGRESFESTQK